MGSASSYLDLMRDAVIFAGGAMGWNEDRPTWLQRAAIRLQIPFERAHGYFYRRIKIVPAWEADHIRARITALQARQEAVHERNQATREAISRARGLLAGRGADGDFGSPEHLVGARDDLGDEVGR